MKTQILCTLGPSSMNDRVITRLEELGVNLFRLNLSHIALDDVAGVIEYVGSTSSVDICLDTEGAQIRTGYLIEPEVQLRENSTVRVPRWPVPGDARCFNLYPMTVLDAFRVGDFLSIDSDVLAQVIDVNADGVDLRVLTGGAIGRNRATTLERDVEMPPLTEKDVRALAIGRELGIRHVALSFAGHAEDVDEIRSRALPGAFVISKIESLAGLAHLEAIAARSDALLIDRGDLSRQVALEKIPLVQKKIIHVGQRIGVPVYVATNLMESMTTQPTPTRAEVNDVFSTMVDGADGLVLAAETAVGRYPIDCVVMVKKLAQTFEEEAGRDPFETLTRGISLLVEPHGGELVQQRVDPAALEEMGELASLVLESQDLVDCEHIALGSYSPITGFMSREAVESVLESHRLPDGTVFPMPIVLRVSEAAAAGLSPGQCVTLCDASGETRALLDVNEVYPFDFSAEAERWFGRDVALDPRVAGLRVPDRVCVAGRVSLVRRAPAPGGLYLMTPQDTRYLFAKKAWNRVVAFHTHAMPHRVHEEIQRRALDSTHADGLYISVETGARAPGDWLPEQVLRAYQMLLDFGLYPPGVVLIGAASTFSRGAGARQAGLLAIARKNMGFSHLIVGRADSEEGRLALELFGRLGSIGIEAVTYETLGYDPDEHEYRAERSGTLPIDESRFREALESGETLPDWYVRSIIQESIRADLTAGRPVFQR